MMTDMADKITICRCEEVSRKAIEDAIKDGATTIDSIKRFTRAGMGLCQGNSCRQLVAKIIVEKTGCTPGEIFPASSRPPFRPMNLSLLAEEGDKLLEVEGADED
jgi:NAD(P)H-nitrite reductase large subunit